MRKLFGALLSFVWVSACSFSAFGAVGPAIPMATPTSGFTNQAITVTFSSKIGADPTLVSGSVVLFEYDINGAFVGSLGQMYDDGTHGDVTAGDGIVTTQAVLSQPSETALYFKVASLHRGSLQRTLSAPVEVDFVRPLTDEEATEVFTTPQRADQYFQTLVVQGLSQAQAQAQTVTWLQQQANVLQAGASDSEGYGIWFLLRSGVPEGILLSPAGSRGGPAVLSKGGASPVAPKAAPLLQGSSSPTITGDTTFNTNGIVLDPYPQNFPDDESAPIAASLTKSCISVATGGPIQGDAANVAAFKTLGNYGVISIVSHGDTWYGGLTWSVTDYPLLKHPNEGPGNTVRSGTATSDPQVVIFTGQILTVADKAGLLLGNSQYVADLRKLNLVIGFRHDTQKLAFVITPGFVSTYAPLSGDRLVYVGACRSLFVRGGDPAHPIALPGDASSADSFNTTMATAFVGAASYTGTYFGYTEYVSSEFAKKQGSALFNALSTAGTTTSIAFGPLASGDDGGAPNPVEGKTGPAKLAMFGDPNLTLPTCVISDETAQFVFLDGEPGNLTVVINGVAQQLTGLGPLQTRNLGFSTLPAGGTYTMVVYANGGFADYDINLPPGFQFSNGQTSVQNHIISFAGPITYQFSATQSEPIAAVRH